MNTYRTHLVESHKKFEINYDSTLWNENSEKCKWDFNHASNPVSNWWLGRYIKDVISYVLDNL